MNLRGKMYIPALLAVGSVISAAQTTTPNAVPSTQTPAANSPAAPPKDPTPPATQTTAPPTTSNQSTTPASSAPAGTAPGANQPSETASFGNLNAGGLTSDQLQQRIDSALHNEPTLSGSNLVVNVADDAIDLSGNVGTAKERLTARRIVQSFAGNRRVRERVTVSGGGARRNEPNGNVSQPTTQESGKSEQQNLNRPITNPATDGDKSEDPR
jgi:hypothetical protein